MHAYIFESFKVSYICSLVVTKHIALLVKVCMIVLMAVTARLYHILFAHVWVQAALKDVTLQVIVSADWAAWLPRHVWHMPVKGHVLSPGLDCTCMSTCTCGVPSMHWTKFCCSVYLWLIDKATFLSGKTLHAVLPVPKFSFPSYAQCRRSVKRQ